MNDNVFGIITVPKRKENVEYMLDEIMKQGFKKENIYVFNDVDYKGHHYNWDRMLKFFADNHDKFKDQNIFMAMDDVEFRDGWYEKYMLALEHSDYPIVTGFVNRIVNKNNREVIEFDNFDLVDISGTFSYYDVCNVWRKGIIDKVHYNLFRYYIETTATDREIRHLDIGYNKFLDFSNIKYALIMKNAVSCQDIPSVLNHGIKINKDL